jgi:tRNA threonylcarbamoyladenosine biosynthesis protein TsaE
MKTNHKLICEITINSSIDMISFGKLFTQTLKGNEAISLEGDLGSGKTTLVKGAGIALKIKEEIISPTFIILREYKGKKPMYHFDFYRLKDTHEVYDISFYDIISADGIKYIEWGNKFSDLEKYYDFVIKFEIQSLEKRLIKIYG